MWGCGCCEGARDCHSNVTGDNGPYQDNPSNTLRCNTDTDCTMHTYRIIIIFQTLCLLKHIRTHLFCIQSFNISAVPNNV